MKRWAGSSVVAMGLLLVGVGPTRADFILNGGFDGPPSSDAGTFNHWTLSGNTSGTSVEDGSNQFYSPHGGQFFAALGPRGTGSPETVSGFLSQTFSDPNLGEGLTVSFWLASNGQTPNEFSATFNGVTLFDQTNVPNVPNTVAPFSYVQHTFNVVSSLTGTNTLQFGFFDDPSFLALDDVSVTPAAGAAVPEPASLTLCGLGLVGLLGYGRIRRFAKR